MATRLSQARQARRILDEKYAAGTVEAVRVRPRSGWIKAVRTGLGMSQSVLAQRLGVSRTAVTQLERAERDGGVTLSKLSEVAAALNCTLVYALVPNTSLEQTVQTQVARVVDRQLGYVNATMTLEDQAVSTPQQDSIRAEQIESALDRGNIWQTR
jgi:predicted DNA-binding mobile mystery protein A